MIVVGKGRGPNSGRGRQVYELTKLILSAKYIPIIGHGKARWDNIHVADLSDVFVSLVEAAVNGKKDSELWGSKGYYLVANGEQVWGDLSRAIGKKAAELGYVEKLEEKSLDREAAIKQAGFEAESWGLNSRGKAERARKLLKWSPNRPSIEDEIPEILKSEHELLANTS